MKILFLGYAVDKVEADSLSGSSIAGNKMQLNVLRNLNKQVAELEIITVFPIAAWPKDKVLYLKKGQIDIEDGLSASRVPFLNLPILKQVSQIVSVYRCASRYIRKNRDAIVFTFNMYPQVGTPAVWLKKRYGCKIVSLLADLPIDDNYKRKGVGKYISSLFNKQTQKNILQIDKAIVLNRHAQEVYAPNVDYIVVEGGINPEEFPKALERTEGKKEKNIVYSGSLTEYSGIKELIDSLDAVKNKDVVLDIYGDGPLKCYVKERVSNRIRYHGKVSNEEMLQIQRNAWLLVNPRPIDDPIVQVTFPSKIFEYMMSGVPVLATKINGFTDEYEGKIFFAENNSPLKLASCINKIADMSEDELCNVISKAREFLLTRKTWDLQVANIKKFIES